MISLERKFRWCLRLRAPKRVGAALCRRVQARGEKCAEIEKENQEFFEMVNLTDKKVYIQENYDKECMFLRNKYMVDNSSLLIAYYHYQRGGTHSTVTYAIKQNKNVLYV